MLRVEGLSASYGRIQALRNVSMRVERGEVVAVLGTNGAGKSTLLRCLSRLVTATSGRVLFEGQDLARLRPDEVVRAGIAHVPERRMVFGPLTVEQNLTLGSYVRRAEDKAARAAQIDEVFRLFPILKERLHQRAGSLSGGEQQMLAIGRALLARPKLLLLDEPSLGLAPKMTEAIFKALRELRSTGLTILLVEQNTSLALSLSDRAYVLAVGTVQLEGFSPELLATGDVRDIYLGQTPAVGQTHTKP